MNNLKSMQRNETRRRNIFSLLTPMLAMALLLSFSMPYVLMSHSSTGILSVQLTDNDSGMPLSREQWTMKAPKSVLYRQTSLRIAMISTYPPTQCGIATYAEHSRTAIEAVYQNGGYEGLLHIDVIEMVSDFAPKVDPVVFQVKKTDPEDYRNAAKFINQKGYNIVMVEHEFGIYGGPHGAYLIELLSLLNDSVKVQLNVHIADLNAPPIMNMVFQSLLSYTNQVVGLSDPQCSVLQFRHRILRDSCNVIPHGVPSILSQEQISSTDTLASEKRSAKVKLGYDPDQVLMISGGLLSPSKNLMFALDVFEILYFKHPKLNFIIAGVTHPKYEEEHGSYSKILKDDAKKRGIDQRIDFVDHYLTDDALQQYYKAADIYLSVYPGMQQTSSGMILFAMAAGCAVVTSPFMHASSLIGQSGGGVLVPLDKAIFAVIMAFITDDAARLETAAKGAQFAQSFHWEMVGKMYLDSFHQIQALGKIKSPTISVENGTSSDNDDLSIISNRHFLTLTKQDSVVSFGLWGMNDYFHEFLCGGSFLAFSVTHNNGRREDINHRLGTSITQIGTNGKGVLVTREVVEHCGTDNTCETVVEIKSEWSIDDETGVTTSNISVSVLGERSGRRKVQLSRFIFGVDQISSSQCHQLVMHPHEEEAVSATFMISTMLDPPVQLIWEGDPKRYASFESVNNSDGCLHYATMAYDLSNEKSRSVTVRNTLHALVLLN